VKSSEKRQIDQSEPLITEVRIFAIVPCSVNENNYETLLMVTTSHLAVLFVNRMCATESCINYF